MLGWMLTKAGIGVKGRLFLGENQGLMYRNYAAMFK